MTFYELKGPLGCEKPIFHLTTGEVQKAVEGGSSQENPVHHRLTAWPSCQASDIFATFLSGSSLKKKKKAKTERREAGVKATGRKERV